MSYWKYIVAKKKYAGENEYSIREAYYNDSGKIYAITEDQIAPISESLEGLRNILLKMLDSVNSFDVVDLDNIEFAENV